MRARSLLRIIPGLVVVAVLCVSATVAPPAMAPPYFPAPCLDYSESGSGASTAIFSGGDGVTQPLLTTNTVSACSLRVMGIGWSYAVAAVREWDPVALAPDPSTIALRTVALDPSSMNYYTSNAVPWMRLSPPIVAASVAGAADPPRSTLSMEVRSTASPYGYQLQGYYEPDGDGAQHEAQMFAAGGAHQPLTGNHPVVAHAVCEGPDDVRALRIAQAVNHTDTPLLAHPPELLQRFQVPEPIEVGWIELAVNRVMTSSPADGVLMPALPNANIELLPGMPGDPPIILPPRLASATFESPYNFLSYIGPAPRWGTPGVFDQRVTLYPGHDYWLHVSLAGGYEFLSHELTGTEGAAFTTGIGALHTRLADHDPWTLSADNVLSFKVVGRPTAPVGAPVPPARAPAFRLVVAPNPAPGPLRIEWSGAVGPVQLELLDPRGRRIAAGSGGAAGSWSWSPAVARSLPSGVYFVRARDAENRRVSQQIVVVQ